MGVLFFLGLFDGPADKRLLEIVFPASAAGRDFPEACKERGKLRSLVRGIFSEMHLLTGRELSATLDALAEQGLITRFDRKSTWEQGTMDCHSLIRDYFGKRLLILDSATFEAASDRLLEYWRLRREHLKIEGFEGRSRSLFGLDEPEEDDSEDWGGASRNQMKANLFSCVGEASSLLNQLIEQGCVPSAGSVLDSKGVESNPPIGAKRVAQLVKLLDKAAELSDELVGDREGGAAGTPSLEEASQRVLGIRNLKVKRLAGNEREYQFDLEGKTYRVSSALGELLLELVREGRKGEDEFVSWKSTEELEKRLKISRSAVQHRVRRLRRFLDEKTPLSRELLQSDPNQGYRIMVRRGGKKSEETGTLKES